MKKILTLCAATLLLLGANQANAQDWLHCDFEIPAGGTTPNGKGWVTWDPTSREIIANPEKSPENNSDYVFHFKNAVQWDIVVNYYIDPKLQTSIYSGVRFKVFITQAGTTDTGTESKVSFIAKGDSEVSNQSAVAAQKGVWTEMEILFNNPIDTDKVREVRFNLDTYGSQAYFDDITFIAKTSGVVNQTDITVTGEGGATEITTLGGTLQMGTEILPINATDKNVYWSVSDKTIADIDGNGLLTAKANGTVDVIAKCADLQKGLLSAPQGKVTITVSNQLLTGIKVANKLETEVFATSDMVYATSPKTIKQASVYSITGTKVASQVVNGKKAEINITALVNGVYVLELQSDDNLISLVKFIKK